MGDSLRNSNLQPEEPQDRPIVALCGRASHHPTHTGLSQPPFHLLQILHWHQPPLGITSAGLADGHCCGFYSSGLWDLGPLQMLDQDISVLHFLPPAR